MAEFSRDLSRRSRRAWLCAGLISFGVAAMSAALPQDYPSRPIRMIVPVPAGGTPAQFADFMHAELVKWGKIARDSGAHVE